MQLHIHTEWLEWFDESPVAPRLGDNIADFCLDDQKSLLKLSASALENAGAQWPSAFRAGNYGADDDTLRALRSLDINWDTSFNARYKSAPCRIDLDRSHLGPINLHGVVELPVTDIFDLNNRVRPMQVCALSALEMTQALDHAAANKHPAVVIVCHSFEMLSRDRQRPNHSVIARFQRMCEVISHNGALNAVGFVDLNRQSILSDQQRLERLPANTLRTGLRILKQGIDRVRYERSFWS